MQTLRDLRTIFLGKSPNRWPTRSLLCASKWEMLSALPNPQGPPWAGGPRAEDIRRQDDPDTLSVRALLASLCHWLSGNEQPCGPVPRQVYRAVLIRKTAALTPHYLARQEAGQGEYRAEQKAHRLAVIGGVCVAHSGLRRG